MPLINNINERIARLLNESDEKIQLLLSEREKELLRAYQKSLKEIKSEISRMYEKYGEKVTYADMVSYQRLTNLEQKIAGEIKLLNKAAVSTTELALKDIFPETFYRYGYAMETSIGARLGFGLLDPNVINASLLNPLDRIKWTDISNEIANKYLTRIKRELTTGLIQGHGYVKIANSLNDISNKNAYERLRIIRTEGHRVQSTARNVGNERVKSAADRLGIDMAKIWLHSKNKREPRQDHIQMNGVEADKEGVFTLPDGTTTVEPGLTGVAEHDINCGCSSRNKIKKFTSGFKESSIQKPEITNISYSEWGKLRKIPVNQ